MTSALAGAQAYRQHAMAMQEEANEAASGSTKRARIFPAPPSSTSASRLRGLAPPKMKLKNGRLQRSMTARRCTSSHAPSSAPGLADGAPPPVEEMSSDGRVQEVAQGNQKASTHISAADRIAAAVETANVLKRHGERLTDPCLIDPRTSKWSARWDALLAAALSFTAVITPYEVGFLEASSTWLDLLFIVNRIVDLIFVGDLVLQFFLMFSTPSGVMENEQWVGSRKAIAWHYLKGWFFLDVVSIGASAPDIYAATSEGGASEALANLKVLRVALRMLRLIKMMRLARMSRMLKRIEMRTAVDYTMLKLCKSLIKTVLSCHWFACIWGLEATFHASRLQTWMGMLDYCKLEVDNQLYFASEGCKADFHVCATESVALGLKPHEPVSVVCATPINLYVASFYWAVMTITSIGYGDIAASPYNASEQFVAAVLMLLGGVLWANVIGELCSVVATLNPDRDAFNRTMDALNKFMTLYNFPAEARYRLREYFHAARHLRLNVSHRELLQSMSPSLKAEVASLVHSSWILRIPYLKDAPDEFMAELLLQLQAQVYAPGELAALGYMYIVQKGIVLYGGRVLAAGKVWGLDVIITNPKLRSKFCGRAMNYLEVYAIAGKQLREIVAHFPAMHRHVRWCAFKLAFVRYLAHALAEDREARARVAAMRQSGAIADATGNGDPNAVDEIGGPASSAGMVASEMASEMMAPTASAHMPLTPYTPGPGGNGKGGFAGGEALTATLQEHGSALSKLAQQLASMSSAQSTLAAEMAEIKKLLIESKQQAVVATEL